MIHLIHRDRTASERDGNLSSLLCFLRLIRPQWKRLLLGCGALVTGVALQLPVPLLMQYLVDHVIGTGDLRTLHLVGMGIVAVVIAQSLLSLSATRLLAAAKSRVLFDIRLALFEKVLELPLSFFHFHDCGYLMSRLDSDANEVERLITQAAMMLVVNVLSFVMGMAMIFWINWKLALVTVAVIPLLGGVLIYSQTILRKMSWDVLEQHGHVQAALQEGISGIFVLKSFLLEKTALLRLARLTKQMIRTEFKTELAGAVSGVISQGLLTFSLGAVLWLGTMEIIAGRLTVGGLMAFMSFRQYLILPTEQLSQMIVTMQRPLAAIERILEVLSWPQSYAMKQNGRDIEIRKGEVLCDNVCFSYNGDKQALEGVSLSIAPGSMTALVGPSGAGKTSLVMLLLRHFDFQEGEIRIDGFDIHEFSPASLRRQVAVVPQETFLFSTTVAENIRCGYPCASDSDVIEAARLAHADEFIQMLPQSYQTVLSERGGNLSGGERQRIAIARALVRRPKILIFDEATSQLDSQSERLVRQALESLHGRCTTIVIAHRLSTVQKADSIVVLKDGQVCQVGCHRTLYVTDGIYRRLCEEQLLRV